MDPLHAITLGDVLRELGRSHPGRTAVVDGEVRLTFDELDARVDRLAAALAARGVGPGGRLLWLGQNSFRVLELLLAAARLGAVLCPANWRQSVDELVFVIDDVDPTVVVWQEAEVGERVRAALEASGGRFLAVRHDADPDAPDAYETLVAGRDASPPQVEVDPASPVLMLYTAAFTGRPNGALISHTAIVVQDLVVGLMQELSVESVYLNCGPLFHAATLMTTLATFHLGGTNVFTPRVDAEELCRLIDAEGCTGAFLTPPTIEQMVAANADGRYDLSSLRSPPGPPEWNAMVTLDTSPAARRPAGFGQTEVMGLLTLNAWGIDCIGNAGRPSPMVQVRIVDPDGNDVAPGETGEIVARGPTVMSGYHNRPELTAERLAGAWHHTHDLGRRERDGSITFVGPLTRLIRSAAENIYPAEVEACLRTHPAVRDAAVIGVPDRRWGQRVKAIVVLRRNRTATAGELVEHCRQHIASYKKPKEVVFVDELPRVGWAVDYDALDERFGGGGYPGAGG